MEQLTVRITSSPTLLLKEKGNEPFLNVKRNNSRTLKGHARGGEDLTHE
jgi:hypothetical protein